jgi:hypothetical protein
VPTIALAGLLGAAVYSVCYLALPGALAEREIARGILGGTRTLLLRAFARSRGRAA